MVLTRMLVLNTTTKWVRNIWCLNVSTPHPSNSRDTNSSTCQNCSQMFLHWSVFNHAYKVSMYHSARDARFYAWTKPKKNIPNTSVSAVNPKLRWPFEHFYINLYYMSDGQLLYHPQNICLKILSTFAFALASFICYLQWHGQ